MIEFNYGEKLGNESSKAIAARLFVFADKDKYEKMVFIWNCFNKKPVLIRTDEVKTIETPSTKDLYFYLERQDEVYIADFDEIVEYVENLEPWEDIDAYIFDSSYEWVIAITHEDVSLVIGLDEQFE